MYIDEELEIKEDPVQDAISIGTYETDNLQNVMIEYSGSKFQQILYNAKPSCNHKIQAQWSGIKCLICGGWYCA